MTGSFRAKRKTADRPIEDDDEDEDDDEPRTVNLEERLIV
jgi:hypothetical protein